jgi:hypothetical protein
MHGEEKLIDPPWQMPRAYAWWFGSWLYLQVNNKDHQVCEYPYLANTNQGGAQSGRFSVRYVGYDPFRIDPRHRCFRAKGRQGSR